MGLKHVEPKKSACRVLPGCVTTMDSFGTPASFLRRLAPGSMEGRDEAERGHSV